MKTFIVTIDWTVKVKAEDEEEAIEIAGDKWRDGVDEGIYFNAKEVKK